MRLGERAGLEPAKRLRDVFGDAILDLCRQNPKVVVLDGDLASNNGGWQWAASTGTDAVPYFRIFNPHSQSRKFDPDGSFIRRFLPEIREIDDDAVHDPSRLPRQLKSKLGYPDPIVDHAEARLRTIAAFKALKSAET